jgi:NAD(P)-dependent dehydrogenase (short-subunit alcohol dehydrogenase family)
LAERGAAVTITGGNSPERLEAALEELREAARAGNARTGKNGAGKKGSTPPAGFLCRIGGPEGFSPEKAAAFILERAGFPEQPVDLLALAWGPFKKIALQESKPEDWRFLVENNIIFPGIVTSLVLCAMIKRRWGRIALFGGTGTAEIRGFSSSAVYGAAKTALGTLARSAALSARRAGIPDLTCNVICPGLTETEYTGPEERAWYRLKSPGGRALEPGDVARAALAVLENPAFNGAVIPVDGGFDKSPEKV